MPQSHEVARFLGRDPSELLRILKKPGLASQELSNDDLGMLAEEAKQLTPKETSFNLRQLVFTLFLILLPTLLGIIVRIQLGRTFSLSALFAGVVVLLMAQVPRVIRRHTPKKMDHTEALVVDSVIEELIDNDDTHTFSTQVTILYTKESRMFLGVHDGFGTTSLPGWKCAVRSIAEKARSRALPGAILPLYLLPEDPSVFTLERGRSGNVILLTVSILLSALSVVLLISE